MSEVASTYPPKVIVTKIGFDGHDLGSRLVAAFLRDAGMEVIYTPPWQEVATVVKLAIEEDAEVIGISSLAGQQGNGNSSPYQKRSHTRFLTSSWKKRAQPIAVKVAATKATPYVMCFLDSRITHGRRTGEKLAH